MFRRRPNVSRGGLAHDAPIIHNIYIINTRHVYKSLMQHYIIIYNNLSQVLYYKTRKTVLCFRFPFIYCRIVVHPTVRRRAPAPSTRLSTVNYLIDGLFFWTWHRVLPSVDTTIGVDFNFLKRVLCSFDFVFT